MYISSLLRYTTDLPSPSNVEVLTVNASAVSIQWYFDCSEDVLIQLPDNLSFELSVKKSGKEAITFANVSGCCNQHEYSYIYKEIDSQTPYTFGVTAVYGTAKSKTSYFDYYLGWGPLGPPPDLNVTKVDSFSITLQWSPSPYSHSAPPSIYFLYYGLSPDEMNVSYVLYIAPFLLLLLDYCYFDVEEGVE